MLNTILNLFGRSPFAPLQSHMEQVSKCVHLLNDLFESIEKKDFLLMSEISKQIVDLEHQADLIKNDIRHHLPKSLFLPIDRSSLLEILRTQDSLAGKAEDIAVLTTLKPLEILPVFKEEFKNFLQKNLTAFKATVLIVKEMHELLESSFGGIEAEKVRLMADDVAHKEREINAIHHQLLKKLFSAENEMTYTTFHVWEKIVENLAALSNLSETLAFRIRMTLELK